MSNFELAQKAKVSLSPRYDDKGKVLAHITVNNKYEHTFDGCSRISKALNQSSGANLELTTKQLESRLNDGSYFFIEDKLVDFRDNQYDGFTQTDDAIENLMSHIGYVQTERTTRAGLRLNTVSSDLMLVKRFSSEEFQVPGYLAGGKFQSNMMFNWNPFASHVRGAFELVREICTNGMVGTTELLSHKIPMINRWVEHLDIANTQMQHSVQNLVKSRMTTMGAERASVADLLLVAGHTKSRRENTTDKFVRDKLDRLTRLSDPIDHCSEYYTKNVFGDKNIAARVPGHLTQFDLFNIITEVLSHTPESEDSSAGALQKFANKLLFPKQENIQTIESKQPIISHFSDPDIAFFGM